jgi:hypothetical protein
MSWSCLYLLDVAFMVCADHVIRIIELCLRIIHVLWDKLNETASVFRAEDGQHPLAGWLNTALWLFRSMNASLWLWQIYSETGLWFLFCWIASAEIGWHTHRIINYKIKNKPTFQNHHLIVSPATLSYTDGHFNTSAVRTDVRSFIFSYPASVQRLEADRPVGIWSNRSADGIAEHADGRK